MQTDQSSATAYERLRLISSEAQEAASIAFDWIKLVRSLQAVMSERQRRGIWAQELDTVLDDCLRVAVSERQAAREKAYQLQGDANRLNERIQAGAYNEQE